MKTSLVPLWPREWARELAQADDPDARLNRRLAQVAHAATCKPGESFPHAMGSDAATEARYRFLHHPRVTMDNTLEPHVRATALRMAAAPVALVVHDTSEFPFAHEEVQDQLGVLSSGRRGFLGHFALGVSAEAAPLPLGWLGLHTWTRPGKAPGAPKPSWSARYQDPNQESRRWSNMGHAVEERCPIGQSWMHLMDREGDDFDLWADLTVSGCRFVVRLCHDRLLESDSEAPEKLSQAWARFPVLSTSEITVAARRHAKKSGKPKPKSQKRHPERAQRRARLRIQAGVVRLKKPLNAAPAWPGSLSVNLVRVLEPHPPEGEPPIEWWLGTTEPIDTAEQVMAVIDRYRARWTIEEYFKALKTGGAYSQRRWEDLPSLLMALAILAPVAGQLLPLRSLTRQRPEAPASAVLTPVQLALLRKVAARRLRETATVQEALWAIAGLGGHLKHHGEPGWITLGRGFHDLLVMEQGWRAAQSVADGSTASSPDPPKAIHASHAEHDPRCDKR